jgi:hypothetical protein
MNAGWLYYDERAILFIGEAPITVPADRPAVKEDRLLQASFDQLGPAVVTKAHTRQERMLRFADGKVFLMPKRYAKRIARLAKR